VITGCENSQEGEKRVFHQIGGSPLALLPSLRRAPLCGTAHIMLVERSIELEAIRQHNDRLWPALAFIHRKPDRLSPVCEQAAALAPRILDHPVAISIPPDEEAR
jgi:hypothetical protein